jgi:hypothetical protein
MKAACLHCGMEHMLNDADLGAHAKVQFNCSKCGKTTVIEIRRKVDSTVVMTPLPSFARAEGTHSNLMQKDDYEGLSMPAGKKVLLTVTTGPSKGAVYQFTKPRMIIGRKGADLALEDPEISRHHCMLEVKDNAISLRDLDSTNGTFYDEERTRAAFLFDGTEFRIGSSNIRVSFEAL